MFGWTSYLTLARELANAEAGEPTFEARLRSAISRAYYAAFCEARNHLRDVQGIPVSVGPQAHRQVRVIYEQSPDVVRGRIGHNLERLRVLRNHADYDDVIADPLGDATKAVQIASEALLDLTSL